MTRDPLMVTVFVDFDDTLWPCSEIYEKAAQQVWHHLKVSRQVELQRRILFSGDETLDTVQFTRRAVELSHREFSQQFSINGFAFAVVSAAMEFFPDLRADEVKAIVKMTSDSIYGHSYVPYVGTAGALNRSKAPHRRLIGYTVGNVNIQIGKLENADLKRFFEHIEVLPMKSQKTLQTVADRYRVGTLDSTSIGIVVGDNIIRDVIPTLQCDMFPIIIMPDADWDITALEIELEDNGRIKMKQDDAESMTCLSQYNGLAIRHISWLDDALDIAEETIKERVLAGEL